MTAKFFALVANTNYAIMKEIKTIILFLVLIIGSPTFAQNEKCNSFEVFMNDSKEEFTNIRQTPNGIIILKINHENYNEYGYILNVIGFENNWLKINKIEGVEELKASNFEGWIHNSVVGITNTHDIFLLDKPNGSKLVKVEGESGETFKIIDLN